MSPNHNTITSVPGIRVGHAVEPGGKSGCTVLLGPFRGAVEVCGTITGARELGVLSSHHVSPTIEALVLSGGSSFGLSVADGVVGWLASKSLGFRIGDTRVPLVPAGVIYDLQSNVPRPDAAMGRAACEAASDAPVPEGLEGVGAGASAGKIRGIGKGMPTGLGSWAMPLGQWTVGALAVTNPFGDVLDAWGGVLAGARDDGGVFVNTARELREAAVAGALDTSTLPSINNTLAVVATDAPLSRVALGRVARVAATAIARRVSPANTPFDGDLVFVVSTADQPRGTGAAEVLAIGSTARDCLEVAIERSAHREEAEGAA